MHERILFYKFGRTKLKTPHRTVSILVPFIRYSGNASRCLGNVHLFVRCYNGFQSVFNETLHRKQTAACSFAILAFRRFIENFPRKLSYSSKYVVVYFLYAGTFVSQRRPGMHATGELRIALL